MEQLSKTITIYPTYIEVTNFSTGKCSELLKKLSVWDKATHSYVFWTYRVDEVEDTLKLPAGIDPTLLEASFPEHTVRDYRRTQSLVKVKNKFSMKFSPRDEIQRKSIDFLKDNIANPKDYQKFLSLGTGVGKTFCAVSYIQNNARKPIIFVRNKELTQQWIDRILDYTDIDEDEIYVIAGKPSITKLEKMKKSSRTSYKIFIASHSTINNFLKTRADGFQDFLDDLGVNVKIYDEAHLDYENIFNIDMHSTCKAIYLTATPSRSNFFEDKVYQNMYRSVIKFSERSRKIETKPENYHNVIVAQYHSKPSMETLATITKLSAKRGFNVNAYTDYLMQESYYNFYEPLVRFLTKAVFTSRIPYNRKTLILVKRIDMVDRLYESLLEEDELKHLTIVKRHSKLTTAEVTANDIDGADLIITTESSMGTGKDIKDLEMTISTIPTSSNVTTTQILGRIRNIPDKNVHFVDFIDVDFPMAVRQLKSRIDRVYKTKAKSIKRINL